ncbi:MAG: alpha amylase C-terminal domain-containing protein [Lachnospiraceae bacterium]|nr:alpha amylase C-terminal domain-containing protein [Lachnospiraceae bacterium]
MNKKQYALMDWEAIESIIYADCAHPFEVLGVNEIKKEKLLQCFFPEAESVNVLLISKGHKTCIEMEKVDDTGFFALFVSSKVFDKYEFEVKYEGRDAITVKDPYAFFPSFDEKKAASFIKGTNYSAADLFGAAVKTINGEKGILFTVYAPEAKRVSVVGEFNSWDGRRHIMEKNDRTGVFSLFIPGYESLEYKYEIQCKGAVTLKSDPYAKLQNGDMSYVSKNEYKWNDEEYRKALNGTDRGKRFRNIYELDLSAVSEKGILTDDVIEKTVERIVKMKYDSVHLLPFAPLDCDKSDRYHFIGMFAQSTEFGSPDAVKRFVDACHKSNLPVMFDFCISYFSADENSLSSFDGTGMFEHSDLRRGFIPALKGYSFRFSNPVVESFLFSALTYMLDEYHFDGLCVPDMAALLYLDFGKKNGQYIKNEEGGNTNTEGILFVKKMNAFLDKKYPNCVRMASLNAVWSKVTGRDSLGFDFVTNAGFKDNLYSYLQFGTGYRREYYDLLVKDLQYANNEDFVISLSAKDNSVDGLSFISSLAGDREQKFANARLGLAYRVFYPGRKETFMGIDEGSENPYKPATFDASVKEDDLMRKEFSTYIAELNDFYAKSFISEPDENSSCMTYINAYDSDRNVVVFERKGKKAEDFCLVFMNFSANDYDGYTAGTSLDGKYKEIFNSDSASYGGKGTVNSALISTDESEYDGRKFSLKVKLPALSLVAFGRRPFTEAEIAKIKEKKRKEIEKFVEKRTKEINAIRDRKIAEANKTADAEIKELKKLLKKDR